jgi:hypothetical protein
MLVSEVSPIRLGQGKDWLALLGNTVENDSLIEAEVLRKFQCWILDIGYRIS